jgi:hypothetical protein
MRRVAVVVALVPVAAMLGVGLALASAAGPDYLEVTSWDATAKNGQSARLTATTKAAIPRHPDAFVRSNPVVGVGWVDLGTSRAFVLTIHPVIGRDSHQRPDGWHAHTVTLAGGATAPNDFCLAGIDSTPTAGIVIIGSTIGAEVRASVLPVPVSAIDTAVGFTVQGDNACASGLAVRIST